MKDLSLRELRNITESYIAMLNEARTVSYGNDGYDMLGYDREGYDRHGRDVFGCDRSGFDAEGYDRLGFDREGWSKGDGWPSPQRDPGAYGIEPSQVDDFVSAEIEKRAKIARIQLLNMLRAGKSVDGVYLSGLPMRRQRRPETDKERRIRETAAAKIREIAAAKRQERIDAQRAEREALHATPEWKAQQERKKEELAAMRRTPEFREHNRQYMSDYTRAKRLLLGRRKWTVDDTIWASTSPVFKSMSKKVESEREQKRKELGIW